MSWNFKYFSAQELLSHDGLSLLSRGVIPISLDAVLRLIRIRTYYDTPFYVNYGKMHRRGWRSPRENAALYGGEYRFSFHFWCAFDVTQDKYPVEEFAESLEQWRERFKIGGLGIYPTKNFVHIDFRDGPFARWVK